MIITNICDTIILMKNITNQNNKPLLNHLKVIYSACAWGTMGLFVRFIDLPTSVIACIRGIIGAIFLYLLSAITTKQFKLDWACIWKNRISLFISGAALGINWILLFEAYRHTSLAIATLFYYLAPIIVMIASTFIYREKLTPKKLLCIILSLVGMTMISGVLNGNVGNGYGYIGMLLAALAAVFYATVTVSAKKTEGLPAMQETILKLLIASIIVIPYNIVTVDASVLRPSPLMVAMLILLGITHTGGAFATYFSALHHLPNQTVAIMTYLDPVVAVLVSVLLLHENTSILELIGAVILIATLVFYEINNQD